MKAELGRGIRLYKMRRYEQALTEFKDLDVDPAENPELSYYLGLCYTKLEQYDEALLYLEQVVTTHINLLHIYQSRMILGYIYSKTGRYRLAEFELQQLIDSGYESAQVYSAYGYIAYELGKREDAVEHLKKAIRLDPNNANALNSLGFILADLEEDLDYAQELVRNALKLRPEHPAYLDSLGWVYFKQGRFREAKEYLRKALNMVGGDKEIADHMRSVIAAQN